MNDWQAELEALFKQTANFVKSVELKIEAPRVRSRAIVEPLIAPPVAKVTSSEREEIAKRVASFKAHQRSKEKQSFRLIRISRLREALSRWC